VLVLVLVVALSEMGLLGSSRLRDGKNRRGGMLIVFRVACGDMFDAAIPVVCAAELSTSASPPATTLLLSRPNERRRDEKSIMSIMSKDGETHPSGEGGGAGEKCGSMEAGCSQDKLSEEGSKERWKRTRARRTYVNTFHGTHHTPQAVAIIIGLHFFGWHSEVVVGKIKQTADIETVYTTVTIYTL
jgi:hypothetical protein